MQDMNFFIQFNSKKKNSDLSTIILSIFVTIIVGFIIITCAYNNIATYINNKEADILIEYYFTTNTFLPFTI